MDLKEYAGLALSTCVLRNRQLNLEHAVLGMITEAGELGDAIKKERVYAKPIDAINLMEEVGDNLWYANLLAHVEGYDLGADCRALVGEVDGSALSSFDLVVALSGSAAAAGACVALGHEHLLDLHDQFNYFMGALQLVADRWGFTMEQAAETNIAKLKKRYPEGFNSHDALNRDLNAERRVLESGAAATA